MKKRLIGIDVIRILCAILILFFHLGGRGIEFKGWNEWIYCETIRCGKDVHYIKTEYCRELVIELRMCLGTFQRLRLCCRRLFYSSHSGGSSHPNGSSMQFISI